MTTTKNSKYPNTAQSFGIAGIMVLAMIVLSPIMILLNKFVDDEIAMLGYYLPAIGIPLWIVLTIRQRKTRLQAPLAPICNRCPSPKGWKLFVDVVFMKLDSIVLNNNTDCKSALGE